MLDNDQCCDYMYCRVIMAKVEMCRAEIKKKQYWFLNEKKSSCEYCLGKSDIQ